MKSMLKKSNSVNKKRVVRKSPSKLRQKAINLSTSKLVKSLEGEFGEKHSLFYLESALKIASKRKIKHDEKISNSTENENENGSGDESDNEECKEEKETLSKLPDFVEEIMKLTEEMKLKNMSSNLVTYNTLIDAYVELSKIEKACQILS